ncbi:type III-B CRISPR module RAMP protein Cmr1 [Thermus tengchongensis]|uniref:Type III-B CRISPR module RAMP protein Cmr1 n=1 Tax=Thermus tengchongensis TaxID=1214928 RepID=A0ABY2K3Z8_9DEIN|nr:type III-B CRISPR module RAMP protein Cmr1 [Thermus tengchongensis]TFU14832.1 type III-B CRISPR module RAMP protein Cmr1 [Thermus tengchongensis]
MRRVREFPEAYGPRRLEGQRSDGRRIIAWERTYRFLTPLFGGGVEPRRADPVSVVRATEVRGQLRFWWRAVRGWQAGGSLERLWALEAALFGNAGEGGASPLQVEVRDAKVGERLSGEALLRKYAKTPHGQGLKYLIALAILGGETIDFLDGVEFTLQLRFPERVVLGEEELLIEEEIAAALWAWETFGGLGARTRRGFGAFRPEVEKKPRGEGEKVPQGEEIRQRLVRYSREGGWPEGVPHLTPKSLLGVFPLSWREVAEAYRSFRQMRRGGQERNRPGRSFWPEPDEVRRLTRRHAPRHAPQHPVRKFPRGQFGLPIIFHFKDEGDPSDSTLKPAEGDRLASPLLIRPLGERATLVAVLEGPRVPPGGVVLEAAGKTHRVRVDLTPEEANGIKPLSGETDPIRAFLKYLREQGGER